MTDDSKDDLMTNYVFFKGIDCLSPIPTNIAHDRVQVTLLHHKRVDGGGYEEFYHSRHSQVLEQEFEEFIIRVHCKHAIQAFQELINKVIFKGAIH